MDRRVDASPAIEVVIRVAVEHPASNTVEVGVDRTAPPNDAMWRPEGVNAPGSDTSADVELTENRVSAGKEHRLSSPATAGRRPEPRRNHRRGLIAATAVIAVTLLGAVTLRATRSPALTAAPIAVRRPASTSSAAGARWVLLDGENSAGSASSQASVRRFDRCRHLLVGAPLVLRADPATWIVTLLGEGAHPGQTLDEVIHDRLVTARSAFRRSDPSDAEAIHALDAVISEAADQPCSSNACDTGPADLPSIHRSPGGSHGRWQWRCAT